MSTLRFVALSDGRPDQVAVLSLNRPEAANALSSAMLGALTAHLGTVARTSAVRALILRGEGKHFSAGADLAWMQEAARLDHAGNVRDAHRLTALFEGLANLGVPTIALVQGSAYGGAVGLAAACDIVVATPTARFCLSEVKLGLMPAVILPYLARRMQPGQLRRLALSGRVFSGDEAVTYGLVQRTAPLEKWDEVLRDELQALLQGSSEAQRAIKLLHDQLILGGFKQGPETAEAIASLRVSAGGQAGLAAFFAKTETPWAIPLAPTWRLDAP